MLHFAPTPNCACEHGKTKTSNLWVFVLCSTSVSWKMDFYSKNQLGHNCGMDRLFALGRKTGTAGNTCLEKDSAGCRKKRKKWRVNSFIRRLVWSTSNMFSITVTTATTVEQVHAEPIWKHLNVQTLKRSWRSANALYVNAHKATHAHTITPTHQIIVALLGNMLGE